MYTVLNAVKLPLGKKVVLAEDTSIRIWMHFAQHLIAIRVRQEHLPAHTVGLNDSFFTLLGCLFPFLILDDWASLTSPSLIPSNLLPPFSVSATVPNQQSALFR